MNRDLGTEAASQAPVNPPRRKLLRLAMVLGAVGLRTESVQASGPVELAVTVDESPPRRFSLSQLQAMPQQEAEVTLRSGAVQRWKGVPVTEILKACGLDLSSNLGGGYVSRRVLAARARDGYAAAFALAEVDPRFGRSVPIVVWQEAEGAALQSHRGPLMLIAPEDTRSSRGVRQLQSLQVLAIP
ncbi:MAG: hypothetical protein EBS47_09410 [Betaproteobacteria bacterium]|nr:hypothetical protein [Betaproteobacteria bacterium]